MVESYNTWYWVELLSRELFLYQLIEQRGEHSTVQVSQTSDTKYQ